MCRWKTMSAADKSKYEQKSARLLVCYIHTGYTVYYASTDL